MAISSGSIGRRSDTDMRVAVLYALENGPQLRTTIAGLTQINYTKLKDQILPQLVKTNLITNVISDNEEVELTSAGRAELETLKGSKILTKSEAGGA